MEDEETLEEQSEFNFERYNNYLVQLIQDNDKKIDDSSLLDSSDFYRGYRAALLLAQEEFQRMTTEYYNGISEISDDNGEAID